MWRRVIFHDKTDKKKKKSVVRYIFNIALKKEIILFVTHKTRQFSSDFKVECEEGKVISAICKYCPKVK